MWIKLTCTTLHQKQPKANRADTLQWRHIGRDGVSNHLTTVYSIVYSDADQRKYQSSASLAFVRGIHWGPLNSPHKWPITRKIFLFDDIIMISLDALYISNGYLYFTICKYHMTKTASQGNHFNLQSPSHGYAFDITKKLSTIKIKGRSTNSYDNIIAMS